VWSVQPHTVEISTDTGNYTFSPILTVELHDIDDNLITDFTGTISLAIGTNSINGVLHGTTAVAAVGGISTFTGLNIDWQVSAPGPFTFATYTLVASSTGVTDGTSNVFFFAYPI
jgi:hypothetical protein